MADSSEQETYWREHHGEQPFVKPGQEYTHYQAAYRTGYEGFDKYPGKAYDEIEDDLALDYQRNRAGSGLPWDSVRPAVKAAWDRVSGVIAPRDVDRGIRTGF